MNVIRRLPAFAPNQSKVNLGLSENWRQIALLVAANMFVGWMIGMERTILPGLAEAEFGITSKTAVVSFIATFGLA